MDENTEQAEQAEKPKRTRRTKKATEETTLPPVVNRSKDEETTDAPKTTRRGKGTRKTAYKVTTALLNVRKSASLDSDLAGEPVKIGDVLDVLDVSEVSDGWGKVSNGYVMMKFLEEVKDNE